MTARNTVRLKYDPYNDPDGDETVEFRLTYEGQLLGSSRTDTRAAHKHEIRKVFHRQLRRYWEINPALKLGHYVMFQRLSSHATQTRTAVGPLSEFLANKYTRCGYRFVPLIREELSLICAINVLFLRPDPPGSVLQSGDIDNRIKTLFDALRLPSNTGELGGHETPAADENPFYCLLEDDKLISHVSVETDMLLEPTGEQFDVNDLRLIITVKIRPYDVNPSNTMFG